MPYLLDIGATSKTASLTLHTMRDIESFEPLKSFVNMTNGATLSEDALAVSMVRRCRLTPPSG